MKTKLIAQTKALVYAIILFGGAVSFVSCGSFGQGFMTGLGGYGGYGANMYGGNMNYLLDPNYAIMQTMAQQNQYNQIFGTIATQSINQVNAEWEQEYQDFCRYNKKSDGSNYTKQEWLELKGKSTSGNASTNYGNSSSRASSRICRKSSASDNAHCNGNGVCSKCNGKGKYYDTSFGNSRWVDPCIVCNGSGKCPSCKGSGRL